MAFEVQSSEGVVDGYTAIIGDYSAGMSTGGIFTTRESQTIIVVADKMHITVQPLDNTHDRTLKPFAPMQPGEKGQLIAEWFEYTPASGAYIALTSNLATVS